MANKYSKLSIDKEKLHNWIQLWCEENITGEYNISNSDKNNRIQYTIDNDGNIIKIDFQKCAGGLLTICPKVGNNVPISMEIAESIYKRVGNVLKDSPFANGYSILLDEENFDVIIELLKEMDGVTLKNYSVSDQENQAKYRLYRFVGPAGDTIVIKYYTNTSRMQMQGKPLFIFNEVVSMLSENGDKQDEVVDASLKYCNIDMKEQDIYEEMEEVLGSELYRFLSKSQKIILSTSFILSKLEGNLGDNSVLLQPANRVYEGFVKKIYAQEGLECDGEKQLGRFYDWPDDSHPEMKSQYADTLDEEILKGFTSMFKFYSIYRHPYMHATAYDYSTSIIENRDIAEEKLKEVLASMKSWYRWYSEIK